MTIVSAYFCLVCRMMSWYQERKQHRYSAEELADVYDGTWWLQSILGDPDIATDGDLGRNLVMGFCADGFNPMEHKNHSMWPIAMTCINRPGHMRFQLPAIWLLCIIPPNEVSGGQPSDFAPFTEILADEMRMLYYYGVDALDGCYK